MSQLNPDGVIVRSLAHYSIPIAWIYVASHSWEIIANDATLWSASFFLMITSAFAIARHTERPIPCAWCESRVPDDAATRATGSYQWYLWFCHYLGERGGANKAILFLVVLICLEGLVSRFFTFFEIALMSSWCLSLAYHQRLREWCPYCRGRDGDDHEALEPDPDPVMSKRR